MSGQLVAMNGTHTSLITIIHENGHAALNMDDLYRFAVGKFDIADRVGSTPSSTASPPGRRCTGAGSRRGR